MIELKPLEIAHKFCTYVQLENTGSRSEFANKLGITPRWVTVYKRKIEELYRVTIFYCRTKRTYFVSETDFLKLPPLFRIVLNIALNVRGSVGILNRINFGIEKRV